MINNPSSPIHKVKPDWQVELLDLDAYLERIGYDGPRTPSVETLHRVHRAHMLTFSFENIDVTLQRGITLDLPTIQEKLVHSGRGGYCFEQNLLLAASLERLGFSVVRHMARVRRGRANTRYRSHVALEVTAEHTDWIADVGFGDEGLIEPIAFTNNATVSIDEWTWRLDREWHDWVLRSLHPEGWFDAYSFRREHHIREDFDVANFYTAQNSRSNFVGKLIAQRGDDKLRQTLKNQRLRNQYSNGKSETIDLTISETLQVLQKTFNITLTAQDRLGLRQKLKEFQDN